MAVESEVLGIVRGTNPESYASGSDSRIHINPRGDLLVAQSLTELGELVRQGGSWEVMGAAQAALTGVPTTTAGYSLWNGESDTGKCYQIDSIGCVEIVTDATQQNSLALFACLEAGKFTAPTDAGHTKGSMSGRAAGGDGARTVAGATVVGACWTPQSPSSPANTAFAGAVWRVHEAPIRGRYMVRPGGLFSIAAVKTVATASQIRYYIRWHAVQQPFVQ